MYNLLENINTANLKGGKTAVKVGEDSPPSPPLENTLPDRYSNMITIKVYNVIIVTASQRLAL